MAEPRRAYGQHAGRRPERLELKALTQEVTRLVALGRAELRIGAFGEDSLNRHAGMKLEILADLSRRVRKFPAALEKNGRRHAAGRKHDHLRANLEAVAGSPRERSHHLPHDCVGLATLRDHLLYLHARQHTRTGTERRRHVGDVHALLRAAPAAGKALAAASTAT